MNTVYKACIQSMTSFFLIFLYISSACVHRDHYDFSQFSQDEVSIDSLCIHISRNIFYSPSYISGSMSERFIYGHRYRGRIRASSSCLFANNAIRSKPTNPTPHPPTADPEWPDSVAQASVIYLNPFIPA